MQKQHKELRRIGLVSSKKDYTAKGNKETAKIVRQINKAEIGLKIQDIKSNERQGSAKTCNG